MSYNISIHHSILSGLVYGEQYFKLSVKQIEALQHAAVEAWTTRKENERSVRFLFRCTDNFFTFMVVFAKPMHLKN